MNFIASTWVVEHTGLDHGTGLASFLMSEVHQAVREFGGHHIWLGVWELNPRAIAFYKKMKFVDVGSQFHMVGPERQVDRVLVTSINLESPGVLNITQK